MAAEPVPTQDYGKEAPPPTEAYLKVLVSRWTMPSSPGVQAASAHLVLQMFCLGQLRIRNSKRSGHSFGWHGTLGKGTGIAASIVLAAPVSWSHPLTVRLPTELTVRSGTFQTLLLGPALAYAPGARMGVEPVESFFGAVCTVMEMWFPLEGQKRRIGC